MELLMCEGVKPKKIHECLKVVYGEDVFDVSAVHHKVHQAQKTLKLLDQDCPDCPKLQIRVEICAEIDKKNSQKSVDYLKRTFLYNRNWSSHH